MKKQTKTTKATKPTAKKKLKLKPIDDELSKAEIKRSERYVKRLADRWEDDVNELRESFYESENDTDY